jgi:hypothetical protein
VPLFLKRQCGRTLLEQVGAIPAAQRSKESLALVIAGGYDPRVAENVEVELELRALAEAQGVAGITHFMRNISSAEKITLLQVRGSPPPLTAAVYPLTLAVHSLTVAVHLL